MTHTPRDVYKHWRRTGQCAACWQDIKHEMHLFNHWKRHHADDEPTQINLFSKDGTSQRGEVRPRYWVWFQNTWVPVQMHVALAAMYYKRCVAVSKPKEARERV